MSVCRTMNLCLGGWVLILPFFRILDFVNRCGYCQCRRVRVFWTGLLREWRVRSSHDRQCQGLRLGWRYLRKYCVAGIGVEVQRDDLENAPAWWRSLVVNWTSLPGLVAFRRPRTDHPRLPILNLPRLPKSKLIVTTCPIEMFFMSSFILCMSHMMYII